MIPSNSPVDPLVIQAEMRKLASPAARSAPGARSVKAEMRKIAPRNSCGGNCNGGDDFDVIQPDASCTNWIKFTSNNTGEVFEYESKATGIYQMNFKEANTVFTVSFRSTCGDFEKDCDTKVQNGGKLLRLEDNTDADYTDLIIACVDGVFAGRYSQHEKTLTYTSGPVKECPEGCECENGECVNGDPCAGVECPECHECQEGECVDLCGDQFCVEGACVNCRDDNDCEFGFICENGDCIPGCRGDDDCQPWEECINGECQDRCPDAKEVWNGEECICDNGFIEVNNVCQPQCPPRPPVEGGGDCDSTGNNPCHGVTCIPPRECIDGACVCPAGMIDIGNGLCIAEAGEEACTTTYCPPNSTCQDGICVCDEGYVKDHGGYCVMAETPDCIDVPSEDCCPSNKTIQLVAGKGLGGGGSFSLNQSEDKTIMFWIDESEEEEECNEIGQAEVCTCTHELAKLMEVILSIKQEIERVKQEQIDCLFVETC